MTPSIRMFNLKQNFMIMKNLRILQNIKMLCDLIAFAIFSKIDLKF
jgi:hypothetical protein